MIGFMPQVIRYSENMASKVGSCIGASSESEITRDNSVSGLALIYIEELLHTKKRYSGITMIQKFGRSVLRRSESHIAG